MMNWSPRPQRFSESLLKLYISETPWIGDSVIFDIKSSSLVLEDVIFLKFLLLERFDSRFLLFQILTIWDIIFGPLLRAFLSAGDIFGILHMIHSPQIWTSYLMYIYIYIPGAWVTPVLIKGLYNEFAYIWYIHSTPLWKKTRPFLKIQISKNGWKQHQSKYFNSKAHQNHTSHRSRSCL